jgi:hypothetical protein
VRPSWQLSAVAKVAAVARAMRESFIFAVGAMYIWSWLEDVW